MPSTRTSAGILLFRRRQGELQVLLAHPGGPFWAKKDEHAWSIPKGEFEATTEDPWAAAVREFNEETGGVVSGPAISLGALVQPGGKTVHAFAVEQDFDLGKFTSNTFSMEWPPRSGLRQEYPEVDRVDWFSLRVARTKILPGQVDLVDRLAHILRDVTK